MNHLDRFIKLVQCFEIGLFTTLAIPRNQIYYFMNLLFVSNLKFLIIMYMYSGAYVNINLKLILGYENGIKSMHMHAPFFILYIKILSDQRILRKLGTQNSAQFEIFEGKVCIWGDYN